jgi:putative ABC transport system substrate-binding protein
MIKTLRNRSLDFNSYNRKWMGIFAIMLTFVFGGVEARAQQPKKIPRIGYLAGRESSARIAAFRQGLREIGYVDGQHIVIEFRFADGKLDRLPELAAELVRLKVDILTAESVQAALAAKNATKTIPIVMVNVGTDPVESGLVESLARPGGNITGFTNLAVEVAGKRLELLKETAPKISRVAVVYDPANQGNVIEVKGVQAAARPLGLTVQTWEIRGTDDFDRGFAAINKARLDGLFVAGGPLMNTNENRIAGFALKGRLPSVFVRREAVDAGGFMAYDSDHVDQYRRSAIYVDKILKGAKPADLPVERPTKFERVFNLKTAKQIGVTIAPEVLARASRIIK